MSMIITVVDGNQFSKTKPIGGLMLNYAIWLPMMNFSESRIVKKASHGVPVSTLKVSRKPKESFVISMYNTKFEHIITNPF